VAEVKIYINGRSYDISCDSGQEGRVVDLAAYIDQRLQQISRSGAAYNDAHLMVLTSLVLADELFDTRDATGQKPARPAAPAAANKEDDIAVLRLLEQLTKRIDGIATKVQQVS
jgi:cell division protein ZapA